MRRRRDNLAARAHSFKENFLEAIGHSPSTSTPQRKSKHEKSFIQLAKKTNSTDNLTGHLGTARSTDCLVKEVQFALKYFEDAVAKKSYDMLPGCATVVLETLLAIQVGVHHFNIINIFTQLFSISKLMELLRKVFPLYSPGTLKHVT